MLSWRTSEWETWREKLNELEATEGLINLAGERRDESLVPQKEQKQPEEEMHGQIKADILRQFSEEKQECLKDAAALRNVITDLCSEGEGLPNVREVLQLAADGKDAAEWVFRSLITEGDQVVVEGPSDPELLEALRLSGAAALRIESGEAGATAEALERICAGVQPKLLVLAPGITGAEGRAALLEAAARRGLTVVIYNGPGLPWRASSAPGTDSAALPDGPRRAASGVIEIGSMEPHLPPLGWIRAAGTGAEALAKAAAPAPSPQNEQVLLHLLSGAGEFSPAAYETLLRQEYAARRELMLSKLTGPSWRGTTVLASSDRHLWLSLPEGLSAASLLRAALLEGAAFLPGTFAYADLPAEADQQIRLTFTGYGRDQLTEGMDRIGAAIQAFMGRLDQEDF